METLKKNIGFVYDKAEKDLEEQILSGRLKAGDCVLSENSISAAYGISRRSARTAIDHLIQKGYLYRRPGKGTFVASFKSGSFNRIAEYSIALIIPDLSDPFILNVCKGVQAAANQYNCNVVIKTSNGDIDRENQNIRYSIQQQEDAVIIFPNYGRFNVEEIWKLKAAKIPFVLIDRYFEDIESNYVCVDNTNGGFLATEHLIKLGHRRIAHLYGSRNSANDDRLAGYRKALSQYNILCDEKYIRRQEDLPANANDDNRFEPDIECGYVNMKFLLDMPQRPTAVFAGNDYQALGAIRAIREYGLSVPDDISIVGFDELNFNDFLAVPLTTIRQPQYDIGSAAVKTVLRLLTEGENDNGFEHIVFPITLIEGASTKAYSPAKKL